MPQDAKIGCIMLSAARATPVVHRRRKPPCLCGPIFHICVCSLLVPALFILILAQCSSSDSSTMNSSFYLQTETLCSAWRTHSLRGSWTPTGTPHHHAGEPVIEYYHGPATPWDPPWPVSPPLPQGPIPRAASSAPTPWATAI